MDPSALIEPATKELLGYGVLGIAVIVLGVLFWLERKDRKAADIEADKIRSLAQATINDLQEKRLVEGQAALSAIKDSDASMKEAMSALRVDNRAILEEMRDMKSTVSAISLIIGRRD